MNRLQLRNMIMEEMEALLQDDAIFHNRDEVGIVDTFEVPGDIEAGRNLS